MAASLFRAQTCWRSPIYRLVRASKQSLPAFHIHTTTTSMQEIQEDFQKAQNNLKLLKKDPGNDVKLKLYALFKQATQGPCNAPKPSMLDFVNKAKWDAWNSLGSLSKDNARQSYVELVSSLAASETPTKDKTMSSAGDQKYETIQVSYQDNITKIILNRPEKKNAITVQMYTEIEQALKEAGKDDSVITVLTGLGDYFCSGNDLNNFANITPEGKEKMAKDAAVLLESFVGSIIDFPKPLIAVVNGPAVGISVTILGLFDLVYATDRATFHTPFSQLGQTPEGCSSYTFPRIMGIAKATEMLLFNKMLTAHEACDLGLVTEVFPDGTFQREVWERLKAYSTLPKNSLAFSKQLICGTEKEKLHAVNAQECERLIERWLSEECMNAIINFFQKKLVAVRQNPWKESRVATYKDMVKKLRPENEPCIMEDGLEAVDNISEVTKAPVHGPWLSEKDEVFRWLQRWRAVMLALTPYQLVALQTRLVQEVQLEWLVVLNCSSPVPVDMKRISPVEAEISCSLGGHRKEESQVTSEAKDCQGMALIKQWKLCFAGRTAKQEKEQISQDLQNCHCSFSTKIVEPTNPRGDMWNSATISPKYNGRQRKFKLISSVVPYDPITQETSGSRISHPKYETLMVNNQENITTIIMNRTRRKNAVSTQMYNEIIQALDIAGRDDSVFTVLTGIGDYFSSGNDLNNALGTTIENKDDMVKESIARIRRFICKFIDFPKPLIAVVNGPAIGIAVTILGLFDLVYATDRATFNTPFIKLGQCPEGCSSYTFPKIMGSAKAIEVLLFNKILTAREACDVGLVTEVFPDGRFQQEVWSKLKAYSTLPQNSLIQSKQLIRAVEKEKLHEVCKQECDLLTERAYSDESANAILNFFQKKAKL
ncbi:uncharacterized protein O3C94_007080 [Discoglossus pictus]